MYYLIHPYKSPSGWFLYRSRNWLRMQSDLPKTRVRETSNPEPMIDDAFPYTSPIFIFKCQ